MKNNDIKELANKYLVEMYDKKEPSLNEVASDEYTLAVENINTAINSLGDPIVNQVWEAVTELWHNHEDEVLENLGVKGILPPPNPRNAPPPRPHKQIPRFRGNPEEFKQRQKEWDQLAGGREE